MNNSRLATHTDILTGNRMEKVISTVIAVQRTNFDYHHENDY